MLLQKYDEDSPMEMTKRRSKCKRKKCSNKGAKYSQKSTTRREKNEIEISQESSKIGSNSSKFSTPIKKSDAGPVIHVIKNHQNREINKNDENYKKDSNYSLFPTPSKESDSPKSYGNRILYDFSQFSTPCKESISKLSTKRHGKDEINENQKDFFFYRDSQKDSKSLKICKDLSAMGKYFSEK